MLEAGGIPQGDYAPVPWLLSSHGWGAWLETEGAGAEFDLGGETVSISARAAAGPFRLHLFCHPSPAARLRAFVAATGGFAPVLPEWAYGHWKSRDVYEHQDDVEDDWRGYRENDLPLDAIVIDSPWETQYNTWRFNPHQFPDAPGMVRAMREDGVRTVVWVTPWVNLESVDGQKPPDPVSEKLHREPAPNYEEGAREGHFVRNAGGDAHVGRWWMGTGSVVDFTSPAAADWWSELARPVFELGVEGVKADDGEGYYFPPDARFADGRSGAEAAWDYGRLYRRDDPGIARRGPRLRPRRRLRPLGLDRPARDRDALGRRPGLGLLVAAGAARLASDLRRERVLEPLARRRRLSRPPARRALRARAAGALGPVRRAVAADAGARPLPAGGLDLRRRGARPLPRGRGAPRAPRPYIRAAAATAARSGLPIMRPLCLVDPSDPEGWAIADSYFLGPALWVAPVLEEGATTRRTYLPRGEWVCWWTRDRLAGRPLDRRRRAAGPDPAVGPRGLDRRDLPRGRRRPRPRRGGPRPPARGGAVGRPRLGRAGARLADGTSIRWRSGEWSVKPERTSASASLGRSRVRRRAR